MVDKIKAFIREWSDLVILAPSALILFVLGSSVIRWIDPTASTLEMGVLSILNWNIFILLVTGCVSYYLYDLWFGDYFKKDWALQLSPLHGAVLSIILWLSTFSISAFILLRNL